MILGDFVSFWYNWGLVWSPWALPRDTRRGKLTAVTKKLVFNSIMVSPKGPFGHPPSTFFVFFTMTFRTAFSKCFSEDSESLRGPPPPIQTVVSSTRNHSFHIATRTSKVTGNQLKLVPFYNLAGSKMQRKEVQQNTEKQVSKNVTPKKAPGPLRQPWRSSGYD